MVSCVSALLIVAEDSMVNKTDMILILIELTLQWDDTQGQKIIIIQYDKCQEVPGKL